jgi:toxin FitB
LRYLLDTCVLSEPFKPYPNVSVSTWFRKAGDALLYISVITLGELQKGISKLQVVDAKRAAKIHDHIHDGIIRTYRDRILPIDLEIGMKWGELAGDLAAKGETIPVADGLLAATALIHGLTVVTRNEKDFRKLDVKLVNPW